MKAGAIAFAAVVAAGLATTAPGIAKTIVFTQVDATPLETDPAGSPAQTSWDAVGRTAGAYADYFIFDVTQMAGTSPTFELTVSETDNGIKTASYYGHKATLSLYSCATAMCGDPPGSPAPKDGTLVDSTPVGPTPNGKTGFSQSAFLDDDNLTTGWYYIAVTGNIKARPHGTSFIPAVTATVFGTAVPEASTWALLALGFAGLGVAGFSRRKSSRYAL